MTGIANHSVLRPPFARHVPGRSGEMQGQQESAMPYRVPQAKDVLAGPVAILWDIENCPVPGEVNAEDVAANIRMALRFHPAVKGAVTLFSAYGDFNHFPRRLREGCQRTGVNLIDVPNGRKDASDKAILVDMFLFALDNLPPSTILLISGDVDFAPALHKLGQRGYTIVLAIPSGIGVSTALCGAGQFVWDWPSLARGEGLISAKIFSARSAEDRMGELTGSSPGVFLQSSDDSDLPTDDEQTYHISEGERTFRQMLSVQGDSIQVSLSNGMTHPALSVDFNGLTQGPKHGFLRGSVTGSQSLHLGQSFGFCQMNQTSASLVTSSAGGTAVANSACTHSHRIQRQNDLVMSADSPGSWVQPGDLQGLKGQLIKLLNANGGKLPLIRVPSEYCKVFGRPLYLAEYGSPKLVHLIERMPDAFSINGEGKKRMVQLKGAMQPYRTRRSRPSNSLHIKEVRGDSRGGNFMYAESPSCADYLQDPVLLGGLEPLEDDENASDQNEVEEEDYSEQVGVAAGQEDLMELRLEVFRQELQELLVSHACSVLLSSLPMLYQQRYCRGLDVTLFGMKEMDSLLDKVKDVAVVEEDQATQEKFLVANYGALRGF